MKKSALACLAALALLIVVLVVWDEVARRSFAPAGKDRTVVTIFGQVQKQGKLPFHEGMTVGEGITLSGGLAQFASEKRIRIVGPTSPLEQVRVWTNNALAEADEWLDEHEWDFSLSDLLPAYLEPKGAGRVVGPNEPLRGGDVLIVPELVVTF